MTAVLEVVDLVKHYRVGAGITGGGSVVHAVDGVSFALGEGEMLGLVGESGSGKSTIAKCILRLVDPTAGTIRLRGTDITHLSRRALRPLRRELHSGAAVLSTELEGKIVFLAAVTDDQVGRGLRAGELVNRVARITGGGGGGKPHLAQAGGRDRSRWQEALDAVVPLVRSML